MLNDVLEEILVVGTCGLFLGNLLIKQGWEGLLKLLIDDSEFSTLNGTWENDLNKTQ